MEKNLSRLFAAAALAAALPSVMLAEHTCWMPSAVHVNIYSNMLTAAGEATGYRTKAEAAYEKWKTERDILASKADELAVLQTEYHTLVEDYRRAHITARPSINDEPDNLRNLYNSLDAIIKRAEALKVRFDGLSGGDGWAAANRRCAQAATDFEGNATAFEDKDTLAQRLRLNGIKWECVLNLYRENFMAAKTKFETLRKNIESGTKEVAREAESAKRADSDIRSLQEQLAAYPAQIAENLGPSYKGISTADGLLKQIDDGSRPRVTVRFRSQGMVVTDGEKRPKKGITPLTRPADPLRPGLVFLYWKKAATREKVPDSDWGKPVEENTDFDAVWGYEVRVAGLDRVFQVVLENEGTPPSLASVFADRDFAAFVENPRPAPPPGHRLAGWQDSDKNRVDEASLVTKSLVISPIYEEIVHTITWQDADGSFLDKQSFSQSRPPTRRELPKNHDGFNYKYWSLEPDGEEWREWGKPLDRDIVLFAFREADHVVRFCTEDRHEISQAGVKHGDRIVRSQMPKPDQIPVLPGKVFVAWLDDADAEFDFADRTVDSDLTLFARYRPESMAESIERQVRPVRERFPLPLLLGADVALLVLLVLLLATGPRTPRKPKATAPTVVEAGDGAQNPGSGAQDLGPGAQDSAPGAQNAGAGAATALLIGLGLFAVPAAAFAGTDAGAPITAKVLAYPALALLFVILAILDICVIGSKIGKAFGRLFALVASRRGASGGGDGGFVPPEKEVCPTCGKDLVDGECPDGHTIVRCSKCSSVMKDGVCPRCGVGGETEFCPTCNSELVDGECPRDHTIVRCAVCGSILTEGVCPKGCNADPLSLGWPGGSDRKLGAFALKVVACPKSEGEGFTLRVPDGFVMGRSSADAKEPFVELLTITRKEKAQCSRQYVRMDLDPEGDGFTVTLLNSSRNPAFVEGKKIVMQNDTAKLPRGGHIKLNPGYELELVEAPGNEG